MKLRANDRLHRSTPVERKQPVHRGEASRAGPALKKDFVGMSI
jgi:hypothetical protein